MHHILLSIIVYPKSIQSPTTDILNQNETFFMQKICSFMCFMAFIFVLLLTSASHQMNKYNVYKMQLSETNFELYSLTLFFFFIILYRNVNDKVIIVVYKEEIIENTRCEVFQRNGKKSTHLYTIRFIYIVEEINFVWFS